MTDERSSQMYLENCIQREISYENKRVELIQQDIRGNVNNIIKKQTITNACNAIHVWLRFIPVNRSELVMLKRAYGGCLGTKSR